MSYDLAVFDPRQELRDRARFEAWYDERSEWEDELDYNNPTNAMQSLQAWFHEIRNTFGPMNGPFARASAGESEDERLADYTIGHDLIYVAFSWGDAESAHALVKELAAKHRVGFLDVSSLDGAAWFPEPDGSLNVVHTAPADD